MGIHASYFRMILFTQPLSLSTSTKPTNKNSVDSFHSSIFKIFKSLAKLSEGSNFVSAWCNATASLGVVASNIERSFLDLFTYLFLIFFLIFCKNALGGKLCASLVQRNSQSGLWWQQVILSRVSKLREDLPRI